MNNLKNIFALPLSRNVPPTQLVLCATYQDDQFLRTRYLRSKLLKKVKSTTRSTKSNCCIKNCQSNLSPSSQKFNKHKTVFGNPRKIPLLGGKDFLDDDVNLNSFNGTTLQVARFKSIVDDRLQKSEKKTETKNALKSNESKSSSQTFIDQEAHSYAKLIANYSRAMESDSFHTRSFDKSFGGSNMLFNSPFERVVSSFSKGRKEEKVGSNFARSSSTPVPKNHRDFQTDGDKNGSSFYSSESGKQKCMKNVDMVFDDLKKSRINESKDLKDSVKLDEKDVLDCVEQRADWLDKIVQAYRKMKTSETIANSEIVKPDHVKKTLDVGKEEPKIQNVSKKIAIGSEDLIIESFLENTPSPIELSFMPDIDKIIYPTEMVFNIEKENLIEAEMKSSSKMGKQIDESVNLSRNNKENNKNNREDSNTFFPTSIYKKTFNKKSGNMSTNDPKNSETSSLLDNIELRIHGRQFSELKSVIIKNDEINIVSSVDKIEIRIPISSSLNVNKNNNENAEKLQRSTSTLKLEISAKIEDKHVVSKDETKSEFKMDQAKVKPKQQIKILLSSPDERRLPNKNFPWRTQIEAENKKVSNFPSKVKEEDVLKKTDLTKTEKSLSLSSKKLSEAAVSAESNDQTRPTSVVIPKIVSKNLETSAKSEKIVKDSPVKDHEEVKIQKNKEVDDNLVKKDIETNLNLHINKPKSRKRRKGTTVISRVIENELMKKNEQIILKDKKVTGLTTETKKNVPLAEALKPETQMDQNTWTIDKVTKTDEVTDQHVKKLSESVTVAKDESKKVLDLSTSEVLKIKKKDLAAKESPKKAIATSVTEGKLPEIKSESEASKMQFHSEKPHTFLNSQTKSLTSLPNVANAAKKDESQVKKSKLQDNKAKPVAGSNNKVDLKKSDGPIFVEKPRKTEAIESKDIPRELKPIKKKKDGTLIDYGLKLPSRKSLGKDFRKSNAKEQAIIKATIKEIIPKKEESLVSGNEKNEGSRTYANALQLNPLKEQKKNNLLKGIPAKAAEITSPSPKEESLKLNSQKVKRVESSEMLLAKPEESLITQSTSNITTTVIKTYLKLLEFEENHIFSGPDRHLPVKDS